MALVAADALQPRARGASALAGATPLMDVSAAALGEEGAAAPLALALDANAAEATGARIVLVRDTGKTTGQLLEELLSTPGVVAAEPNYLVEDADEDAERLQDALNALAEEQPGTANRDKGEGSDAGGTGDADNAGSTGDAAHAGNPTGANATSSTAANETTGGEADAPAPSVGNAANAAEPAAPAVPVPASDAGTAKDATAFQWGNANDGRFAGTNDEGVFFAKGQDIHYGDWNEGTPATDGPIVAILDSGIDETNPDLAGKLWTAPAGLTDAIGGDEHGFAAEAGLTSTGGITGESAHGTHVAGIVAAAWDGTGVSGVSGSAQLMSLRHDDTFAGIVSCFDYAARAQEHGIEIVAINASFGFGGGTSAIANTAVTEVGLGPNHDQRGAITVFSTGNSGTNVDATPASSSLMSENPYVVMVNSLDADGGLSAFSSYGEKTTDMAAPGTGIISTWPTEDAQYHAELDSAPAVYESFEGDAASGTGLEFFELEYDENGDYLVEVGEYGDDAEKADFAADRAFDGDQSMVMYYNPDDSEDGGLSNTTFSYISSPIDISAAREAGEAEFISLRYAIGAGENLAYETYNNALAQIRVGVVLEDGSIGPLSSEAEYSFMALDGTWGGEGHWLPDTFMDPTDGAEYDVDYGHFQIVVAGTCYQVTMVGGQSRLDPIPGIVYLDSVGIGSTCVPYAYTQGTSMSTPAVVGAAAVVAENTSSRGIELAARLRGSVHRSPLLDGGTCLSNGVIDIDKALANPGPAIIGAALSDDGSSAYIWGYWFPDQASLDVRIDGVAVEASQQATEGGQTLVTAKLPEGFAGGQAEVLVHDKAEGDYARAFPLLGHDAEATYYEFDLAVPELVSLWESEQLVGWNGSIYAFPQASLFRNDPQYDAFLRYDIEGDVWEEVALPAELAASVGEEAKVAHMTAAPWKGRLAVAVTSNDDLALWALDVQGAWERLGVWELDEDVDDGMSGEMGTLASDDSGGLYLFAALDIADDTLHALQYDETGRSWNDLGETGSSAVAPAVAYNDGAFLVSGGSNLADQGQLASSLRACTVQDGALEAIEVDMSAHVTDTGGLMFGIGALDEGFMLAGAESDDGTADTYVLADVFGDAAKASAHDKRAGETALLGPSAVAYNGRFYVLSRVQGATENGGFAFVATEASTNPTPGDAADSAGLVFWIGQAQAIDESRYTQDSLAALHEALEAGIALLDSNPTFDRQADVDNAAADIKLAIEGLDEKAGDEGEGGAGNAGGGDGEQGPLPATGDASPAAAAAAGVAATLAACAMGVAAALRRRMAP